jgi:hypothetical protein
VLRRNSECGAGHRRRQDRCSTGNGGGILSLCHRGLTLTQILYVYPEVILISPQP